MPTLHGGPANSGPWAAKSPNLGFPRQRSSGSLFSPIGILITDPVTVLAVPKALLLGHLPQEQKHKVFLLALRPRIAYFLVN